MRVNLSILSIFIVLSIIIVLGSVPAQWEFRDEQERVFSLPYYFLKEISTTLTNKSSYINKYNVLLNHSAHSSQTSSITMTWEYIRKANSWPYSHPGPAICVFLFLFLLYLFTLKERDLGGGAERERERERENPKQALCWHRTLHARSRTHQLHDHNLSQNQELDA